MGSGKQCPAETVSGRYRCQRDEGHRESHYVGNHHWTDKEIALEKRVAELEAAARQTVQRCIATKAVSTGVVQCDKGDDHRDDHEHIMSGAKWSNITSNVKTTSDAVCNELHPEGGQPCERALNHEGKHGFSAGKGMYVWPSKESKPLIGKDPVRVRGTFAGQVVEGWAWDDGRAPGMGMIHRDGFDYAHPTSLAHLEVIHTEPKAACKEDLTINGLYEKVKTLIDEAFYLGLAYAESPSRKALDNIAQKMDEATRGSDAWKIAQFEAIREALQKDNSLPASDDFATAVRRLLRDRRQPTCTHPAGRVSMFRDNDGPIGYCHMCGSIGGPDEWVRPAQLALSYLLTPET